MIPTRIRRYDHVRGAVLQFSIGGKLGNRKRRAYGRTGGGKRKGRFWGAPCLKLTSLSKYRFIESERISCLMAGIFPFVPER